MRMLQTHRDRIVGIMLSKTESKADLDKTVAASTGNLPIIALIEFARGILELGEIFGHTSLVRLAFESAQMPGLILITAQAVPPSTRISNQLACSIW